jgi:ubiquinone/menaquinone biosynthesis C-methylase UbiE
MRLNKSFHELEHEGWSERANFYDELFAGISAQAIAPILDHLGELEGIHLLDVACGTGHLVAAAAKRGAIGTGIDFAEPMIAVAQSNYPQQHFQVADANHLPFGDASFDVITCSFGLSHMEFPQKAVQEAFRVLKPSGYFAFTLWYGANDGGELAAIMQDALTRFATQSIALPEAWTQLRHAKPETCDNILKQAGFILPEFVKLPITIQAIKAETLFNVIGKLSIRTRMVIDSEPLLVQQQIFNYAFSEIESRRVNGLITTAWPALLTVAQKPI